MKNSSFSYKENTTSNLPVKFKPSLSFEKQVNFHATPMIEVWVNCGLVSCVVRYLSKDLHL